MSMKSSIIASVLAWTSSILVFLGGIFRQYSFGSTLFMRIPSLVLSALALATLAAHAENEIGFIEKFALAPDREAVLGQLIPGSEDYYFFNALHFQTTKQKEKLAAIMGQWAKRFLNSQQRRVIENRTALLNYDADPQATLRFLRERLNLQFNQQQEARDKKPDLPSVLDPARIAREVFQREALRQGDDLHECSDAALETLVREKAALKPEQVRALLARLKRPDVPNLIDVIAAELKTKESGGFGEFEIHRALLPEQLDDLAKRIPSLPDNQAFVFARLRKLAPGANADAEFDPAEREAWLDRAWAYASKLSPSFNSLKANLLHQRLQHDRARGVYDEARFLEYLKLPRRAGYMNPKYLDAPEQQRRAVDLSANFAEAMTTAIPINDDEPLVRDYFLHIFPKLDANLDAGEILKTWTPLVRESWLKPLLAEAMITNGVGEPERWASLLSPAAFQMLKDRVDVDFAATNPQFRAPSDDVSLDLFVKNAPKLIVKVYEINTLSFFLTQQRQLNTDLQLDGLVANKETTHDLATDAAGRSPFRRVARKFEFPELKGKRGAWVIEFIGGGKSSRALVRKGQWSLLQRTGPAGDMVTVLDEAQQPVKDAAVWLEGRKFLPDEKSGFILVPFTKQPGNKPIVLADAGGDFATLTSFEHHAEQYRLDAQFHIEREQLLARREATLAVRAALLLGDAQVSPELLQETKLAITSTTFDGVSTTAEVKAPKLDAAKDFTHTIQVPERLASLTVTLSGKIDNLSKGGEKQDLSASQSWPLNGIDKTEATNDGHLSQFGDSYVFELLGKNGEPLPDQQVVFDFTHRDFTRQEHVALRTDEKGRVILGALNDLSDVQAHTPNGRVGAWALAESARTWPAFIHANAGDEIEIPFDQKVAPGSFSLLEKRAGTFVSDRTASVIAGSGSAAKTSLLRVKDLAPGDYSLRLRDGGTHEITIRVTAGKPVQNWIKSPNRSLEIRDAAPLQIEDARSGNDGVVIRIANANRFTRVHVAATRFLPGLGLFELGCFARFEPGWSTPDKLPNLFAAGREIGDEYRYILERRYSKLFPGNLLTRPGLLLNPWEVRPTDLLTQQMAAGESARAMGGARGGAANTPAPAEQPALAGSRATAEGTNLDFLADAAPVLYNLVPDKNGTVRIGRKALGDRQYLQVYAEDLTNAVRRTLVLPEASTKFQDLRLARNLDPQKAFTEKKEATVLGSGQTLTLADILTSELETYDSLASVHALFTTLSSDARLAKFAWVLQWPKLKDEEKRAEYSEFACHELNLFLARKDAGFFEKVIAPYLRNKKDKTFMDDYLLGNELRGYAEPWAFARLNVAERCLLAQRLPDEAAATARHLRELWELLPPDAERQSLLFETALRGRALSAGGAGDFKKEKEREELAMSVTTAPAAAAPASPRSGSGTLVLNGANAFPAGTVVSAGTLSFGTKKPASEKKLANEMADRRKRRAVNKDIAGKAGEDLEEERAVDALSRSDSLRQLQEPLGLEAAKLQRQAIRQFFRALGPTKEWAENNYYQLPLAQQNAGLITINAFWRDYAAWDRKTPFVSSHVAEASRNFSEMMLALAVLDLPFESPKNVTKSEAGHFTITAGGPLIAFHKEIKPATPAKDHSELLVSQNFYRQGDRYREEDNERFDKYVTDEFLAGVVYGANIVVTNPASSPQKLDLLLQIPQGALPVLGSKATDSKALRLEAYTTKTFEYFFYFPASGAQPFPHYPVNVAHNEESVGAAKPVTFKVVRKLSQIDKASWDYVSQYGSEADVFAFLDQNNIERLNLERIAWRARQNVDFFRKIIGLLAKRHVYNDVLYSFSVVHNDTPALREWLRHRDDFLAQCGPWLDSKLIAIDPIERRAYEHLEYSPLVNQRAHRIGAENRIANPVFRAQYQALLNILAHKQSLDAIDQMSVVYYLFLQDRVEEALARFHAIKPESLPTRIQHDYFRCYAAFYEEQTVEARKLTGQYADYPVDRWRKLFADVSAQLDELEGKASSPAKPDAKPDREAQQGDLAATEPSFDFKVENRQIALTWKNLREVTINYYLMDPEFLFSSSPFVTQDVGRFSIIKPSKNSTEKLPEGKDALDLPLPAEFANANVLVEILGAGQRKAQAYHANTLKLALAENYGRFELRDQAAAKPVSKAYVKVYARLKNGTIRFFKDGYTDLRGKFDYASLNSSESSQPVPFARENPSGGENMNYQMLRPDELSSVEKLAILIMSEADGALVREVNPPSE
jgi:autotransporter-associated beta strand protein